MFSLSEFCCFAISDAECGTGQLHAPLLPFAHSNIRAAVLVGLWQDQAGETELILTRRSDALAQHPGQIAFPGGKVEISDHGVIAAAVREAGEEVGIATENIAVFGELPVLHTLTGFDVFPVLASVHTDFRQPDPAEVAEIFTLPAKLALDPQCYQARSRQHRGFSLTTLTLPYRDYDIWGVTAMILYRLAISFQRFEKACGKDKAEAIDTQCKAF